MKKQNILLQGRNIYSDRQGRPVYYVKSKKRGYRISKAMEASFKTYYSRFILAIIVFIFFYIIFKLNIWISLAATLAAYLFMEYRFRKLLSNCTIIENYEPHKETNSAISTTTPLSGLFLRFGLYLSAGILLIVNAYFSESVRQQTVLLGLSLAVSMATIYFAIRYLMIIIKKLSMAKKGE